MKKICIILAACVLLTSSSFSAEPAKKIFTGNDYLRLNPQQRVQLVTVSIANVSKEGVTIRKQPVFYCQKIDEFYAKRPDMKKEALGTVLKTLIVMEYDWEQAGVNKDDLARKYLGNDTYAANKRRLGK